MTVIFHTNAGLPVLAGDMLISTSGPRSFTDLKLPSHPEGIVIPSDPVPRNIPIKMRRKIFVINDHLVVGAAGDVISIRTFIQHLIDAFGDRPIFASQEVKEFLNGYASSTRGRDVFDQIHFVLLVEAQDWRGSFTRRLASRGPTFLVTDLGKSSPLVLAPNASSIKFADSTATLLDQRNLKAGTKSSQSSNLCKRIWLCSPTFIGKN